MSMTLSERLKQARMAAGFENASEFARAIAVQPNSIYRYERGDQTPSLSVATRWAEVTSVSLGWLSTGEGAGPGPASTDTAAA